jgi:hypothetical protein
MSLLGPALEVVLGNAPLSNTLGTPLRALPGPLLSGTQGAVLGDSRGPSLGLALNR